MSFINQYRTQLKQHTISTLLLSLLILFTLVLVILRLSLSAIIILSAERWLATQSLDASIQRIEISLLNGRVSLHDAHAQNAQQQGFNIGELTLDWDWLPLFNQQVEINEVILRDFSLDIELQQAGELNIGGIQLAAATAQEPAEDTPGEQTEGASWQAAVHRIDLSNIQLCAKQLDNNQQALLDYCSKLQHFNWQGELAYRPLQTQNNNTNAALPLYVNGGLTLQSLQLHNRQLQRDLLQVANVKLPQLNIDSLDQIKLETIEIETLSFLQQAVADTSAEHDSETTTEPLLGFAQLQIGPLSVTQQRQIALGNISLNGLRSHASITADNQLDIQSWLTAQSTPPTETDNQQAAETSSQTTDNAPATVSKPLELAINNVHLSDTQLCTRHAGNAQIKPLHYCVTLKDVDWQGELAYGKHTSDNTATAQIPIYVNGQFALDQLRIINHQLKLNLLAIDTVQIDQLSIDTPARITMNSLQMDQFAAFQRSQQQRDSTELLNTAYIYAFEQLRVTSASISTSSIALGEISMTGSETLFVIEPQGKAEINRWLIQTEATETTAASTDKDEQPQAETAIANSTQADPQAQTATDNSLNFSLDEFIYKTDKPQGFIDLSGEQQMQLLIDVIDIHLQNLSTKADATPALATLLIRLSDQASLKLDAQGSPLTDKPSMQGKLQIAALDLRNFSPVVRQQLGQSIRSGQLDAQLDIDIKQGQADSLLDLTLHHFVLRTLNEEEAEKLNKDLGFPLNASLNLLRDKDNKIHLSIPITQDINNLDIDIKPVIYKALSKSVSSAIVNYYTPFGLVFVAESLFDLATALKFQPVIFNPAEASLTDSGKTELDKLATVMSERPGIHLTLCGFTNKNDLPQSAANTASQPATDKPAVEISAEQRQQLLQLAGLRSSVVKQYLINSHKISASRLVECEAEYAADAIAGVEIKL